jgi:putative colanic acid biosynthesis acetyltransferase WcaF
MNELTGNFSAETPYESPWSRTVRMRLIVWEFCWALFCSWTPKPLNRWRLMWLKLFGTRVEGTPFVHQRARIAMPWNLTLHHRACLGDRANAYSLGKIEIGEHATIAQEAYLCSGTHRFDHPALPLMTGKIEIGSHVFVGARAFVMPGVCIGHHAVIGACSVVTKNMPEGMVCAGNPCQTLKRRE